MSRGRGRAAAPTERKFQDDACPILPAVSLIEAATIYKGDAPVAPPVRLRRLRPVFWPHTRPEYPPVSPSASLRTPPCRRSPASRRSRLAAGRSETEAAISSAKCRNSAGRPPVISLRLYLVITILLFLILMIIISFYPGINFIQWN